MTQTPKNPKLPLSKTSRNLFEKRFEEIFLIAPDKEMKDESLMKAVNENEQTNSNSDKGKAPEGIQNEERTDVVLENSDPTVDGGESEGKSNHELTDEQLQVLGNNYFDLFGQKPLSSMTVEQVVNSINVKMSEIEKADKPAVEPVASIELKEGEVLAIHNETSEKRVFQKNTLKYLTDWTETVQVPNEIKNHK